MKYKISHKTYYDYGANVSICHSMACLTPRSLLHQKCLEFKLHVEPVPSEIVSREDFYGNTLHYFSMQSSHKKLSVLSKSIVEVFPNPLHSSQSNITYDEAAYLFKKDSQLKNEMLQFILPSMFVEWDDEIRQFASNCFAPQQPLFSCIQALCRKIYDEFDFDPFYTTVNTPVKTVLKAKKGVCQDFSHLAIACFRSMGLAARYVSGYLETLPPPGKPKLQGSDASHAWISVYIPHHGWYDFDPTNNITPSERHITIAWGRDYGDVPPLKGIIFSSTIQSLKVEVDVIPIV